MNLNFKEQAAFGRLFFLLIFNIKSTENSITRGR